MMASAARDAVLVVDDYVPTGSAAERAQLKAKAERLLRAQGNNSGRGRLRPDGTMRPSRPPAGLVISTGRGGPCGQSLRARTIICEVEQGDVKLDQLSIAQENGARGLIPTDGWLHKVARAAARNRSRRAHPFVARATPGDWWRPRPRRRQSRPDLGDVDDLSLALWSR